VCGSLILERDDSARSLTSIEIRQRLTDNRNILIEHETLYGIIHRERRPRLVEARPMEEQRMEVTDADIVGYLSGLSAQIDSGPGHVVFNMDEVGPQDRANRIDTCCHVIG
jgi:hypothetical protein